MIKINDGWEFTEKWTEAFLRFDSDAQSVRLPHNVREYSLHYASMEDYAMICGYRRTLTIPEEYKGKRLFLQFDGAAHIATVYCNGVKLTEHRSGYTAFRVEITDYVNLNVENCIAVMLDCTENSEIPPFGHVIDYLTYGGLYRDVWLDVRGKSVIDDLFVYTPTLDTAKVQFTVSGEYAAKRIRILDAEGNVCAQSESDEITLHDAKAWDTDAPYLYTCEAQILDATGNVIDTASTTFGFRTVIFEPDGCYINGKKIFLRGLNRHQSYPYIGYAAPENLQREDARILKNELSCVIVRTSHYPQSRHFIDECDRIGLLVFTEIPGWQHIGDDAWKDQAVENVREMVTQYRNHPSIILWGVRINESQDDDALYTRTNVLAHELDPSRPTSGVRFIIKSHLLEDVYSYNDFSHIGTNKGVKAKKFVTPDIKKALIISEHSGHIFPTKSFDPWAKRQEHALRHARVLNDAMADGEHVGCIGWCMFDYQTHKDFGSGDRMCYHGVLDAFRNPKSAAAMYASLGDTHDVLEVCSTMDIGDYPAGIIGSVAVFSNADEVRLYKNGNYVTTLSPGDFNALPHAPLIVDDTIGCLLETQEGFSKKKAAAIRECLNAAGQYGFANTPLRYKLKLALCMLRYKMSYADVYALYGKYIGNWGGESTCWRFDGIKNGVVVSSVTRCPVEKLHLDVKTSCTKLTEDGGYDACAVRVRILDGNGTVASYAQLPVKFSVSGVCALIGPDTAAAEGGMCGTYVKTLGIPGDAVLTVSAPGLESVMIKLCVEVK